MPHFALCRRRSLPALSVPALGLCGALALAGCATEKGGRSPSEGIGRAGASSEPTAAAEDRLERDLVELVEGAYVRQALREAPNIVTSGVRRIGSDLALHPERETRIEPVLARYFTEARLLARFKERLQSELSPGEIHTMAEGLRTQPVRRMNELGLRANQAPPEELFAYLKRLENNPPPQGRVKAVKRLVASYSGAELTVAMVAAPLVSVSEILAVSVRTDEDAAMVRALHRAALKEIGLDKMTPDVLEAALIFAFRHVSDEDLRSFADFFESDLGQRYHQTMVKIFFEILHASTEAATTDIRAGTERERRDPRRPPPEEDRPRPEDGRDVLEL